jgi:hypothetical protein
LAPIFVPRGASGESDRFFAFRGWIAADGGFTTFRAEQLPPNADRGSAPSLPASAVGGFVADPYSDRL